MSSLRFKVVEEASNRKAVEVDIPKEHPQEYYASKVFNRAKMCEYLPLDTYKALINAIDNKEPISLSAAETSVCSGAHRCQSPSASCLRPHCRPLPVR